MHIMIAYVDVQQHVIIIEIDIDLASRPMDPTSRHEGVNTMQVDNDLDYSFTARTMY